MPEIEQRSAAPGTTIPMGSLITPGGDKGITGSKGDQGNQGIQGIQGPQGVNACTSSTADFIVPAVGQQVVVPVQNSSWIVVGQMLYVDTAGGGAGQTGCLKVIAKTSTSITLQNVATTQGVIISEAPLDGKLYGRGNATWTADAIQADAPSDGGYYNRRNGLWVPRPLADATQNGLLKQVSGLTTDFIRGDNTPQNLASAVQPTIWSMRLRSFNSVGNPNFEVDQRLNGVGTYPAGSLTFFQTDRWQIAKVAATGAFTAQLIDAGAGGIVVPTTSFAITSKFLRITLTTAQASLAAGEYVLFQQFVEGPFFRELMSDVHSLQALVRTSVSGLKFGMSIRGPQSSPTSTLTKLSPALTANQWTLVQFPNLPTFPSGWPYTPGNAAYYLAVTLACGSTWTSPANDTWQSAQYFAPNGQSNFAASAVNSTFDLAFIQHQPGPYCETLIDKPFTQNLDECLRYYFKTWAYGTAVGTATQAGANATFRAYGAGGANGYGAFAKRMAKVPTVNIYGTNGTLNNVADNITGGAVAVTGSAVIGDQSFLQITASALTQGNTYVAHYTADTGM
jgi:hypothetical protein